MNSICIEQKTTNVKSLKALFAICLALIAFVFCLQAYGNKADKVGNSIFGQTTAGVVTWTEQTFWDIFWGNGFFQTRTKYTATPDTSASTQSRVYENSKLLVSFNNGSSAVQKYKYTTTERIGHEVSANLKAKKAKIEASVGYTFNYETTTSKEIEATCNPHCILDVYTSDVRIRYDLVALKTQKQTSSWTGWKNTGSATTTNGHIKEFSGLSITFIEY